MINKFLQIRSDVHRTAIVILVATLTSNAFADSESDDFKKLTAKWWQWALSIPATENPMLGDLCTATIPNRWLGCYNCILKQRY